MAPARPLPLPLLLLLLLGARLAGGAAAGRAELNDECQISEECAVENSSCIDNVCKCNTDFVNSALTRCLPVATEYDQECEIDQQCKYFASHPLLIICSPLTNTCRCSTNYHYASGACWFSSYLGDPCSVDEQCYVDHASCQIVCQCSEGYEELDNTCIEELPHCELISGSIEEDGECVCEDPDQVIESSSKQCVTVAFGGHNDDCSYAVQCQERMGEGAECASGKCSCGDGYHYLHGICWSDAGYGEECAADEECTQFGEWDAYACVDNACACAVDAAPTRPGGSPVCRRIARENEECESHVDCIEGLTCYNTTEDSGTSCYGSIAQSVINARILSKTRARAGGAGAKADCDGAAEEPTPSGNQCVCQYGFFRASSSDPCLPELGEPCSVGEEPQEGYIQYAACRRSAKKLYSDGNDAPDAGEDGVWACIGGFAPGPDNRECYKTQQFTEECQVDAQCGYYGGVCDGASCICETDFRFVTNNQLCWPIADLNEVCVGSEHCVGQTADSLECYFDDSSTNTSEGICVCKSGFHPVKDNCRVDAVEIGEICIDDIDCVFAEGDVSVACINGLCACNAGYAKYNETICIYEVPSECNLIDGAVEENGECVCEDRDYVIDGSRSKCIKSALDGFSAACTESVQCLLRMGQGAGCSAGQCACLDGFHYLHGLCWSTKAFGDECSADAQCYQFAEGDAYACVDNKCACAPDAEEKRPGVSPICRRNAREGEECESTLDCVEDLICDKPSVNALDSICQVDPSRLSSRALNISTHHARGRRSPPQRRQPVAPVVIDARIVCGANEQQTPSHDACMCQRGYYRPTASSGCVPELGEPCYVGDDPDIPQIEYASCRRSAKYAYGTRTDDDSEESPEPDGVWACLGGFVAAPDNRECEKTRQNTYNCQIDAQCGYYGGICSGTSCSCEKGHHYVTEKLLCWVTKGLNEECDIDADCGVDTEDSVHCDTGDSTGGSTEDSADTKELEVQGMCRCKDDYYAVIDDCRKKAYKLNERCVATADCVFGADDPTITCYYGYCSCQTGYFAFNDTACQIGVGGSCTQTRDCRNVEKSLCLDGVCKCKSGYVESESSRCLPIATEYGQECEEDDQCYPLTPGQYSIYCSYTDSTCSCWPNMHFSKGACWSTKYLNDKCTYESECIIENSVCRNNYCTCDYDYVEVGTNTCVERSAGAAPGAAPGAARGALFAVALGALAALAALAALPARFL